MNNVENSPCRCDLNLCYMELVQMNKLSEAELAQFHIWMDLVFNLDIPLMERGRAYELCLQMYDKYAYSWWDRHSVLSFVLITALIFSGILLLMWVF